MIYITPNHCENLKFPANETHTPEGKKVWRRPLISKHIDLGKVSEILQDTRYGAGEPKIKLIPRSLEDPEIRNNLKVHKYKKVEDRIRPIPAVMPEDVKVRCTLPEDPLKNLPTLPSYAPKYVPTEKVTQERMDKLGIDENPELMEEEKRLLKHVLVLNGRSITFEEHERGTFRQDYSSDYKIPITSHVPWVDKNIPLPPGHQDQIVKMLKEKIDGGVYERAQSSYRSRWFCV